MEIDFTKSKHVYFMGIGGISMSGLAQILLSRGYKVSGSDRNPSELTDQLEKEGPIYTTLYDFPLLGENMPENGSSTPASSL